MVWYGWHGLSMSLKEVRPSFAGLLKYLQGYPCIAGSLNRLRALINQSCSRKMMHYDVPCQKSSAQNPSHTLSHAQTKRSQFFFFFPSTHPRTYNNHHLDSPAYPFQHGRGNGRCCPSGRTCRHRNERRNVSTHQLHPFTTMQSRNPVACVFKRALTIICTASSATTAAPPSMEPLPQALSATTASSSPTTYPAAFNAKAC